MRNFTKKIINGLRTECQTIKEYPIGEYKSGEERLYPVFDAIISEDGLTYVNILERDESKIDINIYVFNTEQDLNLFLNSRNIFKNISTPKIGISRRLSFIIKDDQTSTDCLTTITQAGTITSNHYFDSTMIVHNILFNVDTII